MQTPEITVCFITLSFSDEYIKKVQEIFKMGSMFKKPKKKHAASL